MLSRCVLWLVLSLVVSSHGQHMDRNAIDPDDNPLMDVAASLLQNANGAEIGSLVSSFLQSDGGKQLGSMLMGATQNKDDATAQILSGLGSLLTQNNGEGHFDPSVLTNMLGMLAENSNGAAHNSDFLKEAGKVMSDSGINMESALEYLPTLLQTLNSFSGPEAESREKEHAGHSWLMPPLVEKIHVYLDHLAHSELGVQLWKKVGAEKFVKMFSEDGKFKVSKLFEKLENQSFRRYWISLVTQRLTDLLALVSDPMTHKQYLGMATSLFNSFLKTQGFPKSTHFDPIKPTETLSNVINYFFSKYLNYKPNAKKYVQPAVKYVQEIIRMAQEKGILRKQGLNSKELSGKLTDTINLDVIEPVIRVYRAYRFAKKTPQCDKYVMCIVNQANPNEVSSLPGLKSLLSKTSSMFATWFLTSHSDTSFLTLYNVIMEEENCNARYNEKCNDFHVEEIKVTTEYNHNEL